VVGYNSEINTAFSLQTTKRENIVTQYDYIVIGAGSAGCVVANRLTKDPETTVLLLETGNGYKTGDSNQQVPKTTRLEVDWGYFSQPEPYLNDRKIFCSRGKVLGQQFD